MLTKYFYPKKIIRLIRIGNKLDGGYVFNKNLLLKCKYCLSFGLGDCSDVVSVLQTIKTN